MRHEKTTEKIQETAALYALGALDPHEHRAFESHLRDGCPVCQAELSRFEATAAAIGFDSEEVNPPEDLRQLLASRIDRTVQGEEMDAGGPEKRMEGPSEDAFPTPRSWRYLPWSVAASMAIAAILSFYAWIQANRELEAKRQQAVQNVQVLQQLQNELELARENSRQFQMISTALESEGSRLVQLKGEPPAPSSSAVIFWDTKNSQWVVWAHLPPLPSDKVYQLWFVTESKKISAGLLNTDPAGRAFLVTDIPDDLAGLAAAAITLEPAGGSVQPTLPIYTLGRIDSAL